jgi:glutaminyl-tRNA synthetase
MLRELKEKPLDALPFGPKQLAELISLLDNETISGKIAKDVFAEMLKSGGNPGQIVEQKGLKQITNAAELVPIVDKILAANPDNVAKYKEGRSNLFGFFVGQVLKETGGRANPKLVNDLVQSKLSSL